MINDKEKEKSAKGWISLSRDNRNSYTDNCGKSIIPETDIKDTKAQQHVRDAQAHTNTQTYTHTHTRGGRAHAIRVGLEQGGWGLGGREMEKVYRVITD